MRKVNVRDIEDLTWESPKGRYKGAGKQVSEALGRDPKSNDVTKRHPFDVEIMRLEPGQTPYVFHMHSAQWEFYYVMSGRGTVRDEEGNTTIEAGDAFLFPPGEAHQLTNDGSEDLVIFVVADNPFGEFSYQPDSKKWSVSLPKRMRIRSGSFDYFDGEE
ncbi:MAG: cupin domain-containing protein [Vulcanimicrobiaceae bacterium]|jgi:uncharacterized cupin superfamily protein